MLKKDRSLIYIAIVAGSIVIGMAYLTFFVEDINAFLGRKKAAAPVITEQKTELLEEASQMEDAEVRRSLVKFVQAFHYDLQRGYFDPPSYFASITETYYNYHNLTYHRLKDVHRNRMSDMKNFDLSWMVSSLDFDRDNKRLVVSYWTRVNYFKPSKNAQESASIKNEMIINEEGKIVSLRELEVKDFSSYVVEDVLDSLITDEFMQMEREAVAAPPAAPKSTPATPAVRYEGKLYDLGAVETAPEFPGGQRELARYIAANVKYPFAARANKIEGQVYVSFVVEKNGDLSGLYVIRGIGSGCDEEAMKVLRNSPAWKPGMVDGKPVRTSFTLPVNFKLVN